MTTHFSGTYTALITPFKAGRVDEDALRAHVERQIGGGVEGLVPCGTTGESVTLEGDEHARVVKIVVEAAKGRVPVVAGAGTVSTKHSIELAKIARDAKADGLLLVCPYYLKPTQLGLEAHFRAILKEVPMPTMLYNIPGRTAMDMSIETLGRLADVPEIVAVKEATGTVLRAQSIINRFGDRFTVLSGDDALTLPMLAVGAAGVVSVTSNCLPEPTSRVTKLWQKGEISDAQALHHKLLPVHSAMFVESNPGPAKFALADAGHIAPEIRLPLVWPTKQSQTLVSEAIAHSGWKL